jgi:hypothetical protein
MSTSAGHDLTPCVDRGYPLQKAVPISVARTATSSADVHKGSQDILDLSAQSLASNGVYTRR